jgi:hypothetical protein
VADACGEFIRVGKMEGELRAPREWNWLSVSLKSKSLMDVFPGKSSREVGDVMPRPLDKGSSFGINLIF